MIWRIFFLLLLSAPLLGQMAAPDFQLQDHKEQSLDYQEARKAKYYLLFFWHFQCSHCQQGLAKVEQFLKDKSPEDIQVVTIFPFAHQKEEFWAYVQDSSNQLQTPFFQHATDYKATARRAFALKGQPPFWFCSMQKMKFYLLALKPKNCSASGKRSAKLNSP